MSDIDVLKKENDSLVTKLDVITAVLTAKPIDGKPAMHLQEFKKLVEDDFVKKFAAKEETLSDDAQIHADLQSIAADLEDIIKFPMLFNKHIVAVSGGFSSGKSKFLNTLFKDSNIKLSVGIKPVTAIPAFVMAGEKTSVSTFTRDGRRGSMKPEVFGRIDHNFIESLGFNLKDIMPYMTVEVPFNEEYKGFTHICLIDTPGYNPAKTSETENDIAVAFDALGKAADVIWFVDIEAGTLPESDVEFLTKIMSEGDKKIYILVSKADKKESQIQRVINQIKSVCEDNDISIEGISAFSSNKNKEYLDEDGETSVFKFLEKHNDDKSDITSRYKRLLNKIDSLFERYKVSINEDLDRIYEAKKSVMNMQIQMESKIAQLEEKLSEVSATGNYYVAHKRGNTASSTATSYEDFELEIDYHSLIHDRSEQDKVNLKMAQEICTAMKTCVKSIFEELNPDARKDIAAASRKKFCGNCGNPLNVSAKFCGNCGAATF